MTDSAARELSEKILPLCWKSNMLGVESCRDLIYQALLSGRFVEMPRVDDLEEIIIENSKGEEWYSLAATAIVNFLKGDSK